MKKIEVVAAVIENDGAYFVTQRGYGDYEGKWEFPGGKVELGETKEDALVREIGEELRVHIGVDRFLCTTECDYAKFHLTMHTFLCHIDSGEPKLLEHKAAKWLALSELAMLDLLPADREVILHI